MKKNAQNNPNPSLSEKLKELKEKIEKLKGRIKTLQDQYCLSLVETSDCLHIDVMT